MRQEEGNKKERNGVQKAKLLFYRRNYEFLERKKKMTQGLIYIKKRRMHLLESFKRRLRYFCIALLTVF